MDLGDAEGRRCTELWRRLPRDHSYRLRNPRHTPSTAFIGSFQARMDGQSISNRSEEGSGSFMRKRVRRLPSLTATTAPSRRISHAMLPDFVLMPCSNTHSRGPNTLAVW